MNRTIAALAVAIVAPVAWGQSWEFKLSQSVLEPGAASVEVVLTLDPGPDAYAVAGANFNVHASEEGWSNLQSRIPCWAGGCGIFPGTGDIVGSSVVGITLAQGAPILGFTPNPGRIEIWSATFTVTDFAPRQIDLSTETARVDVYTEHLAVPHTRRTVMAIEGSARITVIPAPAGLALLGLGGLVVARRRRASKEMFR